MPNSTKKAKSASTVLLSTLTNLANFITPDANGVVPASKMSEADARGVIAFRTRQALTMARKVCNKKPATKGCDRISANCG
jgi:hypothetical protein